MSYACQTGPGVSNWFQWRLMPLGAEPVLACPLHILTRSMNKRYLKVLPEEICKELTTQFK
jgi:hypothetical protein